jgi:hypothetical protein
MNTPSEMSDKMKDLAGKEGYINGIYNYCDRWCEKCSFTSRCMNYTFGKDAPPADGPEIWDYLQTIFKATSLMLDEMMAKLGMELQSLPDFQEASGFDPERHTLLLKAGKVTSEMHEWLELNKPGENDPDKLKGYNRREKSGISFGDAVEVINWYIYFLPAKIARALSGRTSDTDHIENFDANGSAKIALIAIDRLIASWTIIMNALPASEDEILKILIDLSALRKHTECVFPDARAFVRPGFDE